jgi:hypothetical protein
LYLAFYHLVYLRICLSYLFFIPHKTLGDSLLGTTNNSFDVIADLNANASNDLFLVSMARSGFTNVGAIATLDATGIGAP